MSHTRPRRGTYPAACLLAALLLTACGSRVSPDTVARLTGPAGAGSAPVAAADAPAGLGGADASSAAGGAGESAGPVGTMAPDGGSSAGSTAGADLPEGKGKTSADGGVRAGSCEGFENATGITDSQITVANIADISGPIPGLFQSAQDATKAFITYYNATNPDGICGRSLDLLALDSRSDAGGDQQAAARACDAAFAGVGSVSSADQGGAAGAEGCGFPDIRTVITHPDRKACGTCFSAYANTTNLIPAAVPEYWLDREPQASRSFAMYYVDVPAAEVGARSAVTAYEKAGMNAVVVQGIDTSEFNYSVYAQQMKDKGVRFVQYFGPHQFSLRLLRAMEQQGVEVDVYFEDPTIYDSAFTDEAGETADGVYIYAYFGLYDDPSIPEMVLYRQWLERVAPGADPNMYGVFAWSAARLFVQEATKLGGQLSRASLVQAFARTSSWTANGLHAPMTVGSKETGKCLQISRYADGTWKQESPGRYLCAGLIDSGVGG